MGKKQAQLAILLRMKVQEKMQLLTDIQTQEDILQKTKAKLENKGSFGSQ